MIEPTYWDERINELSKIIPKPLEISILEYFIKGLKPKKTLEVGCNYGRELSYIKNLTDVYGVDYNKKMVEHATNHIRAGRFYLASAISLPFNCGYFDFVYTDGLLSHLDVSDVQKAIQEIIRVSKKFILIIEYLGTYLSTTTISNCKRNTWIHDYERLFAIHNVKTKFNQVLRFGTDTYKIMLFEKCQKVKPKITIIDNMKNKKFFLKIGKFTLGF